MSAAVTVDEIIAGLTYGSLSLLLVAEFIIKILATRLKKRFIEIEAAFMNRFVWRG